ncbi:pilus retraction ATPase PilT (plasmid) [Oceanithermus profundus DSM 14977]|uniref:Pilus retraction ATPase PilT n=1 Tax=Oceanithermus profundus (strain DSM 14977 / NBRC 100410 / VKM B-2274 / 506) TaxID=670487 RepID=E4UAI7_OCEP5|nr:PilT/PilU family type 4a pilus ATPase [Oceanithermus profundus]ADR37766.1 pilus retraction ATPase PilT [Oceanithermus profundus DSM 14977]
MKPTPLPKILRRVLQHLPDEVPLPNEMLPALLGAAVRVGASDLEVADGAPPMFKLNGEVVPLPEEWTMPNLFDALREAIPPDALKEVADRQVLDRDLSVAVPQLGRFRVNLYYRMGAPAAVFRVVPGRIPAFEELGLPTEILRMVDARSGLFLVTGATASGKSTTLAALIDYINTRYARKILTIEDPIEHLHKNKRGYVVQREVGSDTRGFYEALRSGMRQAPDVIMVGELRDPETIALTLTAAETGHLVLGTLHTSGAVGAVSRILDALPEGLQAQGRAQLSEQLIGVLSQRLLPRKDGNGLVLAFELMRGTTAVRSKIREGHLHQLAAELENKAEGHRTMRESLENLTVQGLIDEGVAQIAAGHRGL